MTIIERNNLRAAVGLPLLSELAETERLKTSQDQAEFEKLWEAERPRFVHEWTGNHDSWLSNIGRWVRSRQQVRREMATK